jgi:hypothetical protein
LACAPAPAAGWPAPLGRLWLRGAVFLGEIATGRHLHAEERKEIRGCQCSPHLVGLDVVAAERLTEGDDTSDPGEQRRLISQILQVSGRHGEVPEIAVPQIRRDHDESVGVGIGKRSEEHRIHDAEDGRARPDAKRQGNEGRDGEGRALAQRSQAEGEIFQKSVQRLRGMDAGYGG